MTSPIETNNVVERLRELPPAALAIWHGDYADDPSANAPVGELAAQAADLIEKLLTERQSLSDRIDEAIGALEAIKELADADDAFLCWKTANDSLASLTQGGKNAG